MTKCPVCGNIYGVTHSCSGLPRQRPASAVQWTTPGSFAPLRYFRQALATARLDDGAIIAASEDEDALTYGLFIWLAGQCLIFGRFLIPTMLKAHTIHWTTLVIIVGVLVLLDAL